MPRRNNRKGSTGSHTDECETTPTSYDEMAYDLVQRGLASPLILDRPRRRHHTTTETS